MANFEEFKKKAKNAMETIADVSVETFKLAEEKAKILAKSAKLNGDITREKTNIRRLYVEIGRMYYEQHKDNPGESFVQNCEEITAAFERVAEKQQELEELKRNSNLRDEDFEDAQAEPAPDDNDE